MFRSNTRRASLFLIVLAPFCVAPPPSDAGEVVLSPESSYWFNWTMHGDCKIAVGRGSKTDSIAIYGLDNTTIRWAGSSESRTGMLLHNSIFRGTRIKEANPRAGNQNTIYIDSADFQGPLSIELGLGDDTVMVRNTDTVWTSISSHGGDDHIAVYGCTAHTLHFRAGSSAPATGIIHMGSNEVTGVMSVEILKGNPTLIQSGETAVRNVDIDVHPEASLAAYLSDIITLAEVNVSQMYVEGNFSALEVKNCKMDYLVLEQQMPMGWDDVNLVVDNVEAVVMGIYGGPRTATIRNVWTSWNFYFNNTIGSTSWLYPRELESLKIENVYSLDRYRGQSVIDIQARRARNVSIRKCRTNTMAFYGGDSLERTDINISDVICYRDLEIDRFSRGGHLKISQVNVFDLLINLYKTYDFQQNGPYGPRDEIDVSNSIAAKVEFRNTAMDFYARLRIRDSYVDDVFCFMSSDSDDEILLERLRRAFRDQRASLGLRDSGSGGRVLVKDCFEWGWVSIKGFADVTGI